jgi:hypothetical protein
MNMKLFFLATASCMAAIGCSLYISAPPPQETGALDPRIHGGVWRAFRHDIFADSALESTRAIPDSGYPQTFIEIDDSLNIRKHAVYRRIVYAYDHETSSEIRDTLAPCRRVYDIGDSAPNIGVLDTLLVEDMLVAVCREVKIHRTYLRRYDGAFPPPYPACEER